MSVLTAYGAPEVKYDDALWSIASWMPSQHADRARPELPPVNRLQVAMLERAMVDLTDYPPGSYPHNTARAWISEPSEIDEPLSFAGCCTALNLPVDRVRHDILTGNAKLTGWSRIVTRGVGLKIGSGKRASRAKKQ